MNANPVKAYFSFTKKERLGILVFLTLMVLLWFAPALLISHKQMEEEAYLEFKHEIEKLQQQPVASSLRKDSFEASFASLSAVLERPAPINSLFYFDPNTLSAEGWQELGLSARTARTIQKYLAKGGRFQKPEDIGKIYGLKKTEFERLLPFVRISKKEETPIDRKSLPAVPVKKIDPAYPPEKVFINSADTSAFIALPGIGQKLAGRIVNFRKLLGGFYSVDQISEVYGLSDSVFQQIKPFLECQSRDIKKININTADIIELKAHPYIKYQLANAVIRYRTQHGRFEGVKDLKKVHLISDDLLKKLEPYILY
ncbi:MAG TPA: helix-hairpin-helix domain-containing protein [Agriterribacter sp.]|nr:helix-hairpin-helix domain-containing protein [Agriterribacter sp.]